MWDSATKAHGKQHGIKPSWHPHPEQAGGRGELGWLTHPSARSLSPTGAVRTPAGRDRVLITLALRRHVRLLVTRAPPHGSTSLCQVKLCSVTGKHRHSLIGVRSLVTRFTLGFHGPQNHVHLSAWTTLVFAANHLQLHSVFLEGPGTDHLRSARVSDVPCPARASLETHCPLTAACWLAARNVAF